jgi:hypothetical protein
MPKITARLATVDHPNGQTIRGGVIWTREWQTFDLDSDNAAAVKADPNLEIRAKAAKAEADATTPTAPVLDYNVLKAEAKTLGIPVKGNKEALAAAIAAHKTALADQQAAALAAEQAAAEAAAE